MGGYRTYVICPMSGRTRDYRSSRRSSVVLSLHGKPDPKRAALAVAFTRSLNILLKYVRLYGFEHIRSTSQFNIAWDELQEALHLSASHGLLIGVAGSQLLLEGMPLEGAAGKKRFCPTLSAAGIASLQFTPETTAADFASLIRG